MATKKEGDKQEDHSSKIADEINCSICLDILVNPLTLVPCGHSFCTTCCLADSAKRGRHRKTLCFEKCPQCRHPIKETVRSRELDSLIDTLVRVPNLLFQNEDDKKEYLKRKQVENDRSQILLMTSSKSKKRRRQDNHPPSYNDFSMSATRAAFVARVANPFRHRSYYEASLPWNANNSNNASAAPFDPMSAPLPPPYDFSGPVVPIPRRPQTARRNRGPPPRREETENTSGVSAIDPICID